MLAGLSQVHDDGCGSQGRWVQDGRTGSGNTNRSLLRHFPQHQHRVNPDMHRNDGDKNQQKMPTGAIFLARQIAVRTLRWIRSRKDLTLQLLAPLMNIRSVTPKNTENTTIGRVVAEDIATRILAITEFKRASCHPPTPQPLKPRRRWARNLSNHLGESRGSGRFT